MSISIGELSSTLSESGKTSSDHSAGPIDFDRHAFDRPYSIEVAKSYFVLGVSLWVMFILLIYVFKFLSDLKDS